MAEPLQYLLITVKIIALEKVSFSDIQNRKTVCYPLSVDKKYHLFNRDNLTQPIQMQLSQKEKSF